MAEATTHTPSQLLCVQGMALLRPVKGWTLICPTSKKAGHGHVQPFSQNRLDMAVSNANPKGFVTPRPCTTRVAIDSRHVTPNTWERMDAELSLRLVARRLASHGRRHHTDNTRTHMRNRMHTCICACVRSRARARCIAGLGPGLTPRSQIAKQASTSGS